MKKIQVTAAALSFSLLISGATEVMAASNATNTETITKQTKATVKTLVNLSPIKITAKSTVRLTDVNILTLDDESILTYTLTITNGDNKTLDLLDYWSKLKTNSGTIYSTSLMTKDKEKKKLSAGSSTTLTYTAKIGKNIKVSDLVFQVIKWDFSQPNYESLKGQFKIPATYITSTPSNQSKTLKVFDTPVKIKVSQVAVFASGDYNYVNVGLDLQNIGYKIFEDPKVKFVIKTASGASYPMSVDAASTDYKIQPQDSKTINLMTAIPKSIKLSNMQLQIVQDDETTKLSLPIATLQLPDASSKSLTVQPNTEKYISLGNGKIAVKVSGATLIESLDEHNLSVRFTFRNTTGATADIPKYQFEIQTSDGYRLPITAPITDGLVLQPLEERVINLPINIPANVSTSNLQLFMSLPAATDSKESFAYPVGIFGLPDLQPMQNMIGQKQFIQTSNGILGVTLSSVQRLPWSDGDIVSARIKIDNTGYKTIQLPELTGLLQVDSARLSSTTQVVKTQSVGLLGSNMSTDIYVVSKIPSYLDFRQLHISLLEKFGENATSEWIQFSSAGATSELPEISNGETYKIETSGRQQELRVLRSFVYSGTTSDIIYTELESKNMEDHQLDLSQLAGAYQSANGLTFKANVSQIDTSVGPEEKSIVTLWSKIPKTTSTSDMKLIVGEGITDEKLTPVKETPTGYVNAASLSLAIVQPSVSSTLSALNIPPYNLTVRSVGASLSGGSVNVSFDYSLSRDMNYAIGEFEHKYLFELVDSSTGRTFEQEYIPEKDLKLTTSGSSSFSINDQVFENKTSGSFYLNVYDLFQGQKVKLGTQSYYYTSNNK
ncbi:hypothetical protein [Paenibacillus barengoltzii]|uniref:hypothetical protein n=1 Tax=Paenibacillus barengoltzii TaxID=343517 RepID=UPI002FDB46B5